MQHPFTWLPVPYQWVLLAIFCAGTAVFAIMLTAQGKPLRTSAAPHGILAYEFAWNRDRAHGGGGSSLDACFQNIDNLEKTTIISMSKAAQSFKWPFMTRLLGLGLNRLILAWRQACGDAADPTAVIIDSRSCRSAPTCFGRGFDGGKKIKGIKIHLDKYGFPLAINVSPANVHDSKGIVPVLHQLAGRGFKGTALGDLSYRGQRLSKRRSASPSSLAPVAMAEPSFQREFGSNARWRGLAATVG